LAGVLAVILLAAAAGCVSQVQNAKPSSPGPKPVRSGEVGEIHLFGAVALSVGNQAKPAGVGVVVYATALEGSKGLPLRRGELDILMFDSADSVVDLRSAAPLKAWTFNAAQLEAFKSESRLGEGYKLALLWENSAPKSKTVTVAARYRGARGEIIYSAPCPVLIFAK
jgi:hypothetical protein